MKRKGKINRAQFEKFFSYGIDNKEEAKEGILHFALKETYQKHSCENWFEIPNEEFEKEAIERALKRYKHFYRFVNLNDEPNNSTIDIDLEQLRRELEWKFEMLKYDGTIFETKAGVFFLRERSSQLEGEVRYKYGEGLQGEIGWTSQVFDLLSDLDEVEKINGEKYFEYWILAKLARTINRGDRKEAFEINEFYERLKEQNSEYGER